MSEAKVKVQLVPIGAVAIDAILSVGTALKAWLGCDIELSKVKLDPDFAFEPVRGQYWSTQILKRLETLIPDHAGRVLGITEVDLFIPILTFVFGEAFLNRPPAIISLHRLHPRFYGLPEDPALVLRRAQTEAIHELGHTFGLVHCADHSCVMHVSRVADEIDLKGPGFCSDCAASLADSSLKPRLYS